MTTPAIESVITRRLLLSKEFYLYALERSKQEGALNKMVAVHNFHIAIEIVLRAIILEHGIRAEKTLNIDFETMLNDIDKYLPFKKANKRLPYRQQLRTLNQLRNLVQHHAIEPEVSTMEDWRVFTRRFLQEALQDYFSMDFDSLSRLGLISDELLRSILQRSLDVKKVGDLALSTCVSAAAFEYASCSVSEFIPSVGLTSSFSVTARLPTELRDLVDGFEKTFERIRKSEHFTAIIATGISLADYKRFEQLTPLIQLSISGHPLPWQHSNKQLTIESAEWVLNFVVNNIASWQHQGLNPKVPDRWRKAAADVASGAWPRA